MRRTRVWNGINGLQRRKGDVAESAGRCRQHCKCVSKDVKDTMQSDKNSLKRKNMWWIDNRGVEERDIQMLW